MRSSKIEIHIFTREKSQINGAHITNNFFYLLLERKYKKVHLSRHWSFTNRHLLRLSNFLTKLSKKILYFLNSLLGGIQATWWSSLLGTKSTKKVLSCEGFKERFELEWLSTLLDESWELLPFGALVDIMSSIAGS